MKVVITGAAQDDIRSAFAFLNQHNPKSARSVRSAIRRAILSLRQFPRRGRAARVGDLRELIVSGGPYVVIYTVDAERVTVVMVRHTSQIPRR